ncbi:MAG: helix-turn-helix domain-containing protein [Lentisphaeria bacterium]|jgi:hypothetical protein
MKVSHTHDDWREIIYCGLENQQIDFKGPQDWNEIGRVGRAKFARHAMALANTTGGYIIIGVSEDSNGNPTVYHGLNEKQASSFDPSNVGQTINRYADPAVEFDIVRPVLDGKRYVVFVVYPFKDIPHVCGDACDDELQRGAFYVRTPDARSRVAYRASELQRLIQRALRNQRQLLGRMLRGILYEDRQALESNDDEVFASLVSRSRAQALQRLGSIAMREEPLFEAIVYPRRILATRSLTEVRRVLEGLDRPRLQDFPRSGLHQSGTIYAANESLRGHQLRADGSPSSYWEVYQAGMLYCAVPLELRDGGILAEDILRLTLVTIGLAGQFYTSLNYAEEILNLVFRLGNTNEALLTGIAHGSANGEHRCYIPEVEVRRERSAGDLEAGAAVDVTAKIFQELCERFNVTMDKADTARLKRQLSQFLLHGLLPSSEGK